MSQPEAQPAAPEVPVTAAEAQDQEAPEVVNREEAQSQLAELKAAATKEYSLKNYASAADFYSKASELQMQLNGEMSPDNADLLYAYGRCLYHLGVSKSDVLGNKVAGGQEPAKKKRKLKSTESAAATSDALKDGEERMAEEVVGAVAEEKDTKKQDDSAVNKPFFQITGDENWTDSEDEDDVEAEDPEEEEDDDFAIAYEILDIARVLLTKKLDALPQQYDGKGKGKEIQLVESPEARQIMDRLADTHDLQSEISLENENFNEAVGEGRAALDLKLKLYPQESSLIAEAHFKLALAMEFASVTTAAEGEAVEGQQQKVDTVDESLRSEAASHMESAIQSCKMRVEKEEASLSSVSADKTSDKKKEIKDVKEMISDMEQRLTDLRTPAYSVGGADGATTSSASTTTESDPLRGILGSILGETAADQKARIAEATKTANDLSGLVRKKATKPVQNTAVVTEGKGKRKLEDVVEEKEDKGKKARVGDDNGA